MGVAPALRERIQGLAPKLSGDDITAALNAVICDAQIPTYKRKYLEKSGSVCPFCEGSDLSSGPIQADGPVAWAEVECEDFGLMGVLAPLDPFLHPLK